MPRELFRANRKTNDQNIIIKLKAISRVSVARKFKLKATKNRSRE